MAERRINYANYAFGGQAVIIQEIRDSLPRGLGRIVSRLYRQDVFLSRLNGDALQDKNISLKLCRADLFLKRKQGYSIEDAIISANPPAIFNEWRGEYSYDDWLVTRATDAQLHEFLSWNLSHMISENKDRVQELHELKETYVGNVQQAVSEGRLSPRFAQKAAEVIPNSHFIIADPLYLAGGGTADFKRQTLLLERNYHPHTVAHEGTHLVGGFKGIFLNEVVTEMLANEIEPTDRPEGKESMYIFMDRAVRAVLDRANVTTYELSELYVENSRRSNARALRDLVKERLGTDELGTFDREFRRKRRFWLPRVLFNRDIAGLFASLELLRELEPEMSYEDLILRDLPNVPEEQVSRNAEALRTGHEISVWQSLRTVFSTKVSQED